MLLFSFYPVIDHANHFCTQTIYMDSGYVVLRMFAPNLLIIRSSDIWRFCNFCMRVLWSSLNLLLRVVCVGQGLIHTLFCYMISTGLISKYRNLNLHNLRCVAVVVDSEEAKNTKQIKRLLHWLSKIGVMNVILYDTNGELKKYMTSAKIFCNSRTSSLGSDRKTATLLLRGDRMTIELLAFSDNKETVAKAASYLCSKYLKSDLLDSHKAEPVFTDIDMDNVLKEVGCGGLHPDLLLVYGSTRCHLGFPAWRLRCTEILYMGPLKSMKHGAIIRAIHDFSNKDPSYSSL